MFCSYSDYRCKLSLDTKLVFVNDSQEFTYVETTSTDIYKVLSEALVHNPDFGDVIKLQIDAEREALLSRSIPLLKETYKGPKRTRKERKNEEITVVRLSASIFRFSYTIFGLHERGDLNWEKYIKVMDQNDPTGEIPWLGFICKSFYVSKQVNSSSDLKPEWFLLRESNHLLSERNNGFHVDESKNPLDPIKPSLSQYHSRPLRATIAALKPQPWFSSKLEPLIR